MRVIDNSYKDECLLLLKDLTGLLKEITIEEKELLIQQGVNYSEMVSKEKKPTEEMTKLFNDILERDKVKIAYYIAKISEIIYKEKEGQPVIVSLARGGTPYGILIKKYIKYKFKVNIPHYSVSIIRGKGIDFNSLKYILKKHRDNQIQFVDGWTGKGSIINELDLSINEFNSRFKYNIDKSLAVVCDPAKLCSIYGTREDFGLATCGLNGTVSGLVSRTIHNEKYINKDDFHGALKLDYLKEYDQSQRFIDVIEGEFNNIKLEFDEVAVDKIDKEYSIELFEEIMNNFKVKSKNNIKLSVGESARVLLRRQPQVVLVKDRKDKNLQFIIRLAEERNVKIVEYPLRGYNCGAIIKEK